MILIRLFIRLFILLLLFYNNAYAAGGCFDLKYNTAAQFVPFIVVNSSGNAITGWTLDKVSHKEGVTGSWVDDTASISKVSCGSIASDWQYCEEDITNAPGRGRIRIPQNITDTLGVLEYLVLDTGNREYHGYIAVNSYTCDEESARFPSSGTMPITTTQMLVSSGTGAGQISLSSGTVTVGQINTDVITNTAIADDAITAAKVAAGAITSSELDTTAVDEILVIASGTEGAGTSTTLKVYTALGVTNERKYNNMCLYSASNGERSRILSTGNGFFNVRGFSVAPTDGTILKIYSDGCL